MDAENLGALRCSGDEGCKDCPVADAVEANKGNDFKEREFWDLPSLELLFCDAAQRSLVQLLA